MIKTDMLDQIEKIFKSDKIQDIFKKNIEKIIRTKGHKCRHKTNFGKYQTRIEKISEAVYRKELKKWKELSDNINRLKSFKIPISIKENSDDNNNTE